MTLTQSYENTLLPLLQSPTLLRATLSGPQRLQKSPLQKITFRPIQLHNTPHLQISRFDARQDHTQNILPENLPAALADILAIGFANIHITTTTEELDLRLTKKFGLHIGRKKRVVELSESPAVQPHNRIKNVPLPEGSADRLLQVMGIMTADGKIRPTMRAKFTQINEFLKLLDPLLAQIVPQLPSPGIAIPGLSPLQILDAGCGSAYLTLAAHHYLAHIKKISAQIIGLDVNDDVIQKSLAKSHALNAHNLIFTAAPIDAAAASLKPDIVLALHACDTATDDALALGIRVGAKIILAVPCCHKNLNDLIHVSALAPLHRHGILHQRLADLVTDSFRALILRILGYKTDVIEFVSVEHTARNLMIRAVKTAAAADASFIREYNALKQLTGATPYLEAALGPLLAARIQSHVSERSRL